MEPASEHLQTLRELESRHEEVLRRLDELEKQIIRVLAEHAPGGKSPADGPRGTGGPTRPTGLP